MSIRVHLPGRKFLAYFASFAVKKIPVKDRFSFQVSLAGAAVLGVQILCVWLLPVFFTQDGPAHVYTATVLLDIWQNPSSPVAATYELNDWYVPTWAGSLLLAALVQMFGPMAGEKVLISIIMLSMAAGFFWWLRNSVRSAQWGWVLILPFLLNHLLLMGLYFFLLSTAVAMLFLAWAWSRRADFGWRETAIAMVWLLFCFLIHPVPPALAGVALMVHYLVSGFINIQKDGPQAVASGVRVACHRLGMGRRPGEDAGSSRLLPSPRSASTPKAEPSLRTPLAGAGRLALAGLPCALWALYFLMHSGTSGPVAGGRGWAEVIQDIFSVAVLAPFTKSPHLWAVVCCALMLAFSLRCLIRLKAAAWSGVLVSFPLFAIGLLALSAWVPEGVSGGTLMGYRVGFCFWLIWMIWLVAAVQKLSWNPGRIILAVVFLVAGLLQTGRVWERQQALQPFLSSLMEVTREIEGATGTRIWTFVLNIQGKEVEGRMFAPRNPFLVHAGLRFLDAQKGQVAAIAYQGEVEHFAVRFRDAAETFYFREGFDERPEEYFPDFRGGDVVLWVGGRAEWLKNNALLEGIDFEQTKFGSIGVATMR